MQVASKMYFSNRDCAYFFPNTKGPGSGFQVAVFIEFCDKNLSYVIWHKLA